MWRKLFLICLVIFSLIFPQTSLAHLADQLPYFKMDGKYTLLYPVSMTSTQDFFIPHDLAPENYLVNQEIEMELVSSNLPVVPQILNQLKLEWDYGDGTPRVSGLKNTHTYTKPGSYFLDIYIQVGQDLPQILQSTLVHVLPNKDYKLPKAVIYIDEENKTADIKVTDFKKPLKLDGSKSEVGSKQINSYFWDLGDGHTSIEAVIDRTYTPNYFYYPVLRIEDENGFISDATVTLTKNNNLNNLVSPTSDKDSQIILKVLIGLGVLIGIYLTVFILRKILKK